jgi:16S rRNA (guanine527-N7)-methyltransferase
MLGLKRIETIHGRLQDKAILQRLGGQFDIILSRAFSDLRTLLLLSFPFLKEGGLVIAMKSEGEGRDILLFTEREGARYRLQKTVSLMLPSSSFKRTLLFFEKI